MNFNTSFESKKHDSVVDDQNLYIMKKLTRTTLKRPICASASLLCHIIYKF